MVKKIKAFLKFNQLLKDISKKKNHIKKTKQKLDSKEQLLQMTMQERRKSLYFTLVSEKIPLSYLGIT